MFLEVFSSMIICKFPTYSFNTGEISCFENDAQLPKNI